MKDRRVCGLEGGGGSPGYARTDSTRCMCGPQDDAWGWGTGFHMPGVPQLTPNPLPAPGPSVSHGSTHLGVNRHFALPTLRPQPQLGPHLGGQVHGDSSHPSLPGGPGCPVRPAPAAQSCSPSLGESLEVAGLTGGAVTARGAREWRGTGAVPGAAAAAMKLVVSTGERHGAGWAWSPRGGTTSPLPSGFSGTGGREKHPKTFAPQISPHANGLQFRYKIDVFKHSAHAPD